MSFSATAVARSATSRRSSSRARAHVRVHLRLRGLDEALRFSARGVDQPLLLVRRVLQGLRADGRRLGKRRAEPRLVLLLLARGLGARRLRLVERLLDRLRALGHLREERLVEQPLQDQQQDDEVQELDDQRLVEADEAAASCPPSLAASAMPGASNTSRTTIRATVPIHSRTR